MAVTLEYDPVLSRVRITATELGEAATALFERSTDQVRWTTVRGGTAVPVADGEARLDSYEFVDSTNNFYRVTAFDSSVTWQDVLDTYPTWQDVVDQVPTWADLQFTVTVQTGSITPALDTVWIKNLARPFLNRAVTVTDWSDVERPARAGVFDVVGRSFPVAVTDLHSSRRYTLTVMAATVAAATELDLIFAAGDPILVHTPAGCPVPGMYAVIGDTTQSRLTPRSPRRFFELPLTEVAAPGPDVVGGTVTWQGIVNTYPSWETLIADKATWSDVLDTIGSPGDIEVP